MKRTYADEFYLFVNILEYILYLCNIIIKKCYWINNNKNISLILEYNIVIINLKKINNNKNSNNKFFEKIIYIFLSIILLMFGM